MSVIGIDFGNESCFVAAAKAGGIETLANDYSLRATPSCVAFAGKKRIIGVAAKNQMVTNMKNTLSNFKRMIGRKFNDPQIQNELKYVPFRVEERPDGGVGIRVNYLDEQHVFSPEQITAMLFTKLKETSTSALQAQVNDCVITAPVYFTNAERKALLDAAAIAGLNVLRLMNETSAVALSYGFYKQDLPAPEEKPRNVIFIDFGHASLQVSAVAFNKGKLKMLCSAWDQIGGRDFDAILADYFANEFQTKYRINAKTNERAYLRLLTEVEKIKKQMSANSTKLPLNIECFMEEIDVHSSMARTQMEELCAHLLKRTEYTFKKCLHDSKLSPDEILSVEVVGGSTRIPAVKALIEQIFNKPVCTTLNQDEAVSRGAALQCAILSPAVRVRDFSVTDIQNYPVHISWDIEGKKADGMEIFPEFHAAPFSRLLTLFPREPFNVYIHYADPKAFPDPAIGRWVVKEIKPTTESQEVKVKVRINKNGLVYVASATLISKKEANDAENANANHEQPSDNSTEPMEVQEEVYQDCHDDDDDDNKDDLKNQTPVSPSASGPGWAQRVKGWFSSANADETKKEKKKKPAVKEVDLQIDTYTHGYSTTELQNYHDQERKMIENDHNEKERVDARNALEEFVYDIREKISEDGPLAPYVIESDRINISNQLNDLENWLYEEGEDCEKDVYRSQLNKLHSVTDPIKMRSQEHETIPAEFNELGHTIQMAHKGVIDYRSGLEKYNHLTEAEMINITETAEKAQKWLDDQIGKYKKTAKTSDPPVKSADVRQEIRLLSTCMNSVLNRPKPKPPTPPVDAQAQGADKQQSQQSQQNQKGSGGGGDDHQNAEPTVNESEMDVE